ncbi:MAG: VIT domain-containing protein [Bryobacteraceae bacterium]
METKTMGYQAVEARTGRELNLAMQRLWLRGEVLPAGARLMVQHMFRSEEKALVEAVYAFQLPRDAALRRFEIAGEGFTAHSELRPAREALEAYERGIEAGSLSTLAREYGDGIVNLSVGNIRPGETVTVSLEIIAGVESRDGAFRLRFPFTLAPRYHALAKAVEAAPGAGEMELPESEFGDMLLPRWMRDASALHAVGFDLTLRGGEADGIASPSHALRVGQTKDGASRVSLAVGAGVPDRDLVLDLESATSQPRVWSAIGDTPTARIAAVIPSTSFGNNPQTPRRVAIVLDRSGSMQGSPIHQARQAIEACLAALSPADEFGLLAFDNHVDAFRPSLERATKTHRDAARAFLSSIDARGGTELASAVTEAAGMLGSAGGDLLIITDGQVGATETILAQARATGVRLHCLGIGSASQDRFLAMLARETGGVSRFLTPRERVDLAAVDLFASIGRPVASEIKVTGITARPEPAAAVFAGTPLVLFGDGAGAGSIGVNWNGGSLAITYSATVSPLAGTLRLLQGARLITDLQGRIANDKRTDQRIAARLRALSEEYGLASREMSLVSVVQRAGDQPGALPKTVIVPVGMPQDVEFSAYFTTSAPAPAMAAMAAPSARRPRIALASFFHSKDSSGGLMELVANIEEDGGMPGPSLEDRIKATEAALRRLIAEGHSASHGAFRSHVQRLVAFLEQAAIPAALRTLVAKILAACTGRKLQV